VPAAHRVSACAACRALGWLAAVVVVSAALFAVPQRAALAPVVEADNAYIFLAADRMYAGEGPTSIPPRAPLQPWEWRADWVFLTQWPVGYPALICATRWLTGLATVAAAGALSVVGCAVALVAWFAWVRRCLPRGVASKLLALVAAASTFSMDNLVNPASDTILLAATPLVLLLAMWALRVPAGIDIQSPPRTARSSALPLVLLGLFAGALVWVRYAAVFVPAAVGIYLVVEWCVLRRLRLRFVVGYAVGAVLPVLALFLLNRAFGPDVSAQQQFNLGKDVSWHLPSGVLSTAWMKFTQQTPYAYRPEAWWLYAWILPAAGLTVPLVLRSARQRLTGLLASPPMVLSAACVIVLLGMLVTASVLFQGKFNYVGLARYYQPVRPLYFVLFLGPLLLLPARWWRAALCVPLIMAGVWFVKQDAWHAHTRMLAAQGGAEITDYSRWARHFTPGARNLFAWLKTQAGPDLVVFSNFHEEIALETGIPACPVPRNISQLDAWLADIRAQRQQAALRVLFVLNPDNDYRDYYLESPESVVSHFRLRHITRTNKPLHDYIYVSAAGQG